MKKIIFSLIVSAILIEGLSAANPMATKYDYDECQGSLMPYPSNVGIRNYPDSLTPIMINHVGRHGSRYPASAANCKTLQKALKNAESLKTITPLGKELLNLTERVISLSENKWGALDSLGEAEQRGIASRMYQSFSSVFDGATVTAYSSYSPRAMMSMYSFTHQLDRLNNKIEFTTSTGRANNALLRPFDIDEDYIDFRKSEVCKVTYEDFFKEQCPTTAIERVLGANYPFENEDEKKNIAITEYYVIAGLSAMSMPCDASKYFSVAEYNALWGCFNFRQYLQRTATTVSAVPAEIAGFLLQNMIDTTDEFINGTKTPSVILRFGHAETLMPLLSLMRMKGCYYMTNYFDTVALHWKDFYVVPMASNLQMILLKSTSNKYYVRFDLNEKPVELLPNNNDIYLSWNLVKEYLLRCIYGA